MLIKLQKRTVVPSQMLGYALTLFVGLSIILVSSQFYLDTKPLLTQQTDAFKSQSAVISKNISVFKTLNKEKIYFTEKEIEDLEEQSFVKSISKFNSAGFKINAFSNKSETVPIFYTDLFFESIPTKFLDLEIEEWDWDSSLDNIPIVIPENYLNLYNFGFAESQGLPVLSKNTISEIEFNIRVSGNQKSKDFKGRIVGFSNKINSILVPEEFLFWANNEFGSLGQNQTSRLLLEFNDPSDKAILKYFNENNYSIGQDKLELSKLSFFFKMALVFVLFIAIVIVILSIAFILLSLNLLIQRNQNLLMNLYAIGYDYPKISRFYQLSISSITAVAIVSSIITSHLLRNYYLSKMQSLFDFQTEANTILLMGLIVLVLLLISYNLLILRNVKRVVVPRVES